MKKTVAIVLLGVALVGSNVFWLMSVFDAGVTLHYRSVVLDEHRKALAQTLALLPVVARCEASRADVTAAAALPGESFEPYETDGFVRIGLIGIRFNNSGRLVEVVRGWDPP